MFSPDDTSDFLSYLAIPLDLKLAYLMAMMDEDVRSASVPEPVVPNCTPNRFTCY